jgi:hypothetical protein
MTRSYCLFLHLRFFVFADLIEQRIYWTDVSLSHIKSAKVDGSDVQLITNGLTYPTGIEVHNNDIYFTEYYGKLYKQSKFPGSSKILIHTDTPFIWGVKVYQNGIRTYNVIKLVTGTLVSTLQIYCFTYLLFNTLYTATPLYSMWNIQ